MRHHGYLVWVLHFSCFMARFTPDLENQFRCNFGVDPMVVCQKLNCSKVRTSFGTKPISLMQHLRPTVTLMIDAYDCHATWYFLRRHLCMCVRMQAILMKATTLLAKFRWSSLLNQSRDDRNDICKKWFAKLKNSECKVATCPVIYEPASARSAESESEFPSASLHFHHREPEKKQFSIGNFDCPKSDAPNRAHRRKYYVLKYVVEALKCDLLCPHHHHEEHHPQVRRCTLVVNDAS